MYPNVVVSLVYKKSKTHPSSDDAVAASVCILSFTSSPRTRVLRVSAFVIYAAHLSLDLVLEVLGLLLELLGVLLDVGNNLVDFGRDAAGHQDAADLGDAHETEEEVDSGEPSYQVSDSVFSSLLFFHIHRFLMRRGEETYR